MDALGPMQTKSKLLDASTADRGRLSFLVLNSKGRLSRLGLLSLPLHNNRDGATLPALRR
jgi:hypothetical protein